jgi:predicted RNA-binding protein YlqC (UPF0109 family)
MHVEEDPMAVEPTLKELLETMIRALVDIPEEVKVSEIIGEQTTVFELVVAKEDLGKVIGKQGKTAKALRTILTGASTKLRKRSVLEIIE